MKTKALIFSICLLTLAFFACKRQNNTFYPFTEEESPLHYSAFDKANALMTLHPDSAMLILMGVHDSVSLHTLNRPDYFEFLLLTNEAATRGPVDSFLFAQMPRIQHFYDSLHQKYPASDALSLFLAKSYYCIGNNEGHNEHPVTACENYFQAISLAEEVDETNYPFVNDFIALTYNRLGIIFYDNESWSIAIDNLKKANLYFDKRDMKIGSAFNYETIGEIFYQAGNQDSALYYFQVADTAIAKVTDVATDFKISQTLIDNKARSTFSIGEKEKAYKMLYNAIATSPDDMERKPHYGLLAELYFMDSQYDSALFYYEKSFPFNPYERTRMLNNTISLCYKMGDFQKAAYYATFLGEEVERSETKLALVQQYEKHVKDMELQTQHDTSLRNSLKNYLVMFIVFALIVVLLLFFYKRLKKLMVSNKAQHQQSLSEKEQQLKHKEQELEMTKKKLSFKEKPGDFAGRKALFDQEPIVLKINKLIEKANIMTKTLSSHDEPLVKDKDIMELVKAANQNFDDFSTLLMKDFPRLTVNDVRYCCLFFMGAKQMEAAALMGISQSGANQKYHRLQEVFGTKDPLDYFLNDYFKKIYG